jgi:oxygen-independent coproporphyrinogen-3 oxidase
MNNVNCTVSNPTTAVAGVEFDRELIARYDGKGPRYTSYPTADRFTADWSAQTQNQLLEQRLPGALQIPLSLYFHLPFCNTICYYCGCNKIITKDRNFSITAPFRTSS